MRLTLHESSSTLYPVHNGIPFLGFRLYPTHRRVKRRNAVAFARLFRRGALELAGGEIQVAELSLRVRGWVAHAAYGDTWQLRRALLARKLLRTPEEQLGGTPNSTGSR